MIGAKTLTSVLLALAGTLLAAWAGLLTPERLLAIDAGTGLAVGAFAVFVGTLLFRFGRLHERSRNYFRLSRDRGAWEDEAHFAGTERVRVTIGANSGDALDLPPRVHHAIYVGLTFLLALATLDARALRLVRELPEALARPGSEFCRDEPTEAETTTAEEPGCVLIRRAFELGYAKDLGPCAEREEDEAAPPCDRRQLDEPALHYAWRRLVGFHEGARALATREHLEGLQRDLERRLDHLEPLYGSQVQLIGTAPRAAHHVWTNLPEPDDSLLAHSGCLEATRLVAPRAPEASGADGASRVLEHVLAQLLFETRYEPAAGQCREYHVHWGAPVDVCDRLARSPHAFLGAEGALAGIEEALTRQRYARDIAALEAAEGRAATAASVEKVSRAPRTFISFHCYIEEPRERLARRSVRFSALGHELEAQELRVPPASADGSELHVERYLHVASLLARGFRYGGLHSAAAVEPGDVAEALARSLAAPDFMLARLHGLSSLDLFVDDRWIASRPDLLEVYPYHQHLRNYVRLFRAQYARERGRL